MAVRSTRLLNNATDFIVSERSIVVATRSQSLPSSSRICYEITESLHQVPAFNDAPPVAWDTWSPELSLELYEVKLSITQQDYGKEITRVRILGLKKDPTSDQGSAASQHSLRCTTHWVELCLNPWALPTR